MSKSIENLKSGNYEVVDSQGVSVTTHFIECLQKEFADLEAKLAESERLLKKHCYKNIQELEDVFNYNLNQVAILSQQLAEKDAEIERLKQNYDEVWEDTYFSVREEFELNNNCNECRRCYAEEFNKQLAEKEKFLERIMSGEYIPANIAEKSLKLSNQTAIAELRKVLKMMEEKQFYKKEDTAYCVHPAQIAEYILKQIKSLKGEK